MKEPFPYAIGSDTMMMHCLRLFSGRVALSLILSLTIVNHAWSADYYVSQTGSDTHEGTSQALAFATLQRGVQALSAGDTLHIDDGVYFVSEPIRVRVPDSSHEKPTTIRAMRRNQVTLTAAWEPARNGKLRWTPVGDGVYAAPAWQVAGQEAQILVGNFEGRFISPLRSLAELRSDTITIRHYGKDIRLGKPDYGVTNEAGQVYLRLPGGVDPNGWSVIFARRQLPGTDPAKSIIVVQQTSGLILDGLDFEASPGMAVTFERPGSTHAMVRNCRFFHCGGGVAFDSYSILEYCEYAYPGMGDFALELQAINDNKSLDGQPMPNIMFDWGKVVSVGVESHLFNAANGPTPPMFCVMRYCLMRDVFDGDRLGAFNNSVAHHNVYLRCYDNATEIEGWIRQASRNLRWHSNLVLAAAHGAVSIQADQGVTFRGRKYNVPLQGPIYVYGNVVVGHQDPGWDTWVVIKTLIPDLQEAWFVNNLFWVRSGALYWHDKAWLKGIANLRMINNAILFDKDITGPWGEFFQAHHNAVMSQRPRPQFTGQGGMQLPSLASFGFVDADARDFRLTADSPLRGAGVPVPGMTEPPSGKPVNIGPFQDWHTCSTPWPRPSTHVVTDEPTTWSKGLPTIRLNQATMHLPAKAQGSVEVVVELNRRGYDGAVEVGMNLHGAAARSGRITRSGEGRIVFSPGQSSARVALTTTPLPIEADNGEAYLALDLQHDYILLEPAEIAIRFEHYTPSVEVPIDTPPASP